MAEIIKNAYLSLEIHGEIAVIWLDQQGSPTNEVGGEMINALNETVQHIEQEPRILAAIIHSRKKSFNKGLNLNNLLDVKPGEGWHYAHQGQKVLERIAHSNKSYVAAIHGACLGAGAEISLACHSRIMTDSPQTYWALADTKLGLIPGLSGTQRLLQIVGIEKALELILSGKSLFAEEMVQLGLATLKVAEDDLLALAKMEATRLMSNTEDGDDNERPFLSRMLESFTPTRKRLLNKAREEVLRKTYGYYPALLKVIEIATQSYESGWEKSAVLEAESFDELLQSNSTRHLISLAIATKMKQENPFEAYAAPVDFIGVIGDKNAAVGIVPDLIMKGIRVKMKGDYHNRMDKIKEALAGKIAEKQRAAIIDEKSGKSIALNFIPGLDYGMLENVDMVIDLEDGPLEHKQKTLKDVESMTEVNSVFAVNTSHLSISEIIGHAAHPEKVIGVRYGSPDASVPFVEIIPTPETNKSIIATITGLIIQQGKSWIIAKDNPGFYLGRLQAVYLNEALGLLFHGGDISVIDQVMEEAGFVKGPFKMIDEMGFAEVERIINTLYAHPDPGPKPRTIYSLHSMIKAEYSGQEGRKGFYHYDEETGEREGNEANENIYEFWRDAPRQKIPKEEIHGRLFYEVVNEAMHCLSEEVISSPQDGDLGAVFGLGFPAFMGGPFRHIDALGIPETIAKLKACEQSWGKAFNPPILLKKMAEENGCFFD